MSISSRKLLWWVYPIVLVAGIAAWAIYVTSRDLWGLFSENWPASVTMIFGSFIAGSTPAGGSAVAFPVFTKVLQVSPEVARTFGLMIQSVGMTMASIFILSRGIRVSWRVLFLCIPAGGFGFVLALISNDSGSASRILFTTLILIFGIALSISHWKLKWNPQDADFRRFPLHHQLHLTFVGLAGGYISGFIGSGIDLLIFVAMILCYGFHEKRAIPTSVLAMAAISVQATITYLIIDHPTMHRAYPYWIVAAPVVALGAPFGAWVASKINRKWIIGFVLALIILEVVSTLTLIPISEGIAQICVVFGALTALWFTSMIRHRKRIRTRQPAALRDS